MRSGLWPFRFSILWFLFLSLEVSAQQNASCSGTVVLNATKTEQYLTTPNYETSYKYPNFLECKYIIKAPNKARILIEIIDMEMEPRLFEKCSDYVAFVEEGDVANTSRLIELCEDIKTKQQYITTGNSVTIVFHSDDLYEYRGARLSYRYYDLDSCPPGWKEISDGNCILLVTEPKLDWVKAQERCLDQRSNLIRLEKNEKLKEMEDLFKGVPGKIWTGNNDATTEGKLMDITFREAPHLTRDDYSNQKDNNEENDCMVFQFNDEDLIRMDSCISQNGYLCEMKKDGSSELYPTHAEEIYDGVSSKNSQYTLWLLLFLIGLLFLTIFSFLCFMCWKQKEVPRVHTETATIQNNAFMNESSQHTEQSRAGGNVQNVNPPNDVNRTSRSSPVAIPIENNRPAAKKFPAAPIPNRLPMSEEVSGSDVVETGILHANEDIESVSAAPQPQPRTLPPMPAREGTFHSINTKEGSTVRTRRNKELFERPVMNVLDNVSAISLDEFWSNKKY